MSLAIQHWPLTGILQLVLHEETRGLFLWRNTNRMLRLDLDAPSTPSEVYNKTTDFAAGYQSLSRWLRHPDGASVASFALYQDGSLGQSRLVRFDAASPTATWTYTAQSPERTNGGPGLLRAGGTQVYDLGNVGSDAGVSPLPDSLASLGSATLLSDSSGYGIFEYIPAVITHDQVLWAVLGGTHLWRVEVGAGPGSEITLSGAMTDRLGYGLGYDADSSSLVLLASQADQEMDGSLLIRLTLDDDGVVTAQETLALPAIVPLPPDTFAYAPWQGPVAGQVWVPSLAEADGEIIAVQRVHVDPLSLVAGYQLWEDEPSPGTVTLIPPQVDAETHTLWWPGTHPSSGAGLYGFTVPPTVESRVTQLVVEAISGPPTLRLTQLVGEAVSGPPTLRLTQLVVEAVYQPLSTVGTMGGTMGGGGGLGTGSSGLVFVIS